MLNKTLLFFIIFLFCFSSAHFYAYADSMGNSDYLLQLNNSQPTTQNPQPVINKQPPAFTVQSGFASESFLNPFTFSIDSNFLDFGIISATSPVTRTSTISISNAQMGYQILGSENHMLKTKNGQFIPDTTCDDDTPCTESIPGVWASVTTFGFGYHCDNTNDSICDNTSSNQNLHKHFADNTIGESPEQIVQSINNANKVDRATITYKVNISGSQATGLYTNEVTFLAVPNY